MFLKRLIDELARERVSYCLVGGIAVNLLGIPRMTYDIDLVCALDSENLSRLETALETLELSARQPVRLGELSDAALREKYLVEKNLVAVTFSNSDRPLEEVDVLVNSPLEAERLIAGGKNVDLDGTEVRVVSLEDLIALKKLSGRPQDLDDVLLLEQIREPK